MIIVNADDRAYLLEKIPMVPLDSGTVRAVLLSIDDWLMTNGFAHLITTTIQMKDAKCRKYVIGYMKITY